MNAYKIYSVILTVLSIVLLSLTIYYANNKKVEYRETIKRDTTVIHSVDTLILTKKDIVYKETLVLDTIYIKDTAMLFEQKVFEDSLSTIYISGVNPELDSIEYRLQKDTVKILTETTNTTIQKDNFWKNRFVVSAGLFAGYGLINRQPDVFLGVGCAVRLY